MIPANQQGSTSLISGQHSSTNKYGSFGISNERLWVKPGKVKGIVLGVYNCGKTTFFGSNPAALIINLDRSSTPVASTDAPGFVAQMWPGLDPDGRLINFDRSIIPELTQDIIDKMIDSLVEASTKGLPRPETIVFDSITEWINILRKATLAHFKKDTWDEGRGDAMWEWLYNKYSSSVERLRSANYGVYIVAHIAPEYYTEGNVKKTIWSLTTPPGFFKRFYGSFEIAVEMQRHYRTTTRTVINKQKVGDQVMDIPMTITEQEPVFIMVGENPERASLYKRRVAFPVRLEMTLPNLWQTFEDAYLKVAVPPSPQSK